MKNFTYRQVPTDRSVSTLASYAAGEIIFKWSCTGNQVWHPAKTALRARCRLAGAALGTPLTKANNVGINMDFLACTMNRIQLKVNNKVVSEIPAYVGQVDMLFKRLYRPKQWLDTVGDDCEQLAANAYDRCNKFSSDGRINRLTNDTTVLANTFQDSQLLTGFEAMWQPGMDIWGQAVLGQGNWSLHIFPLSNVSDILYNVVESVNVAKTAVTDFNFDVTSLYLDVATSSMPGYVQPSLDLVHITLHSDALTGQTSYTQQNFTVAPNTKALTYAVQSALYNSQSLPSASKFTLPITANGSQQNGFTEATLRRLQINYKGVNFSQNELDPQYSASENFLFEMYNRNLLNTDMYSPMRCGESFDDWIQRGIVITAPFDVDGVGNDTIATIQYQYNSNPSANGEVPRVLLFSHEAVRVQFSTVDGGVITDSQVVPL
jgi:hypothetical protein